MSIYVRFIFAKIFHPRTKSEMVWIGKDGTIMPRQRVIMYTP